MRNMARWVIVGAALFALANIGCSKHENSKDLAALESAYKSGVLSKSEYQAKKAALQARAASLAALDQARDAGLLTKDEYLAKQTAILNSDPPAPVPSAVPATGSVPPSTFDPAPQPDGAAPAPGGDPAATPPPLDWNQPAPDQNAPPAAAPPPSFGPPPAPAAGKKMEPAAAVTPPAPLDQGHSYRMKMIKVMDQYGFEQPMVSASMLVPLDWQSQGSTTWNVKDGCNTIQTTLRATGPDGRAYEVFPAFRWVWADDPRPLQQVFAQKAQVGSHACDVIAPMSAQDYLRRNLSRIRPNSQVVGFEPAPKMSENLQQQAQQIEQGARQYNMTKKVKADAIRARLRYSVDGKPVEEWIVAGTLITGTLGPSMNLQTGQLTQAYSYSGVAFMGADRAPQGQLDASQKFFELLASTYQVNPEWQAKVNGNALAIQKIEAKGVRDRNAIIAKSAEDTANIRKQGVEYQQRTQDQTNQQFSQMMRGVETYQNPGTGEKVELDSNYGHAWVNNKGEYLLTDQIGYDPNVAFKDTGWTQLQHVKQ